MPEYRSRTTTQARTWPVCVVRDIGQIERLKQAAE